MMPRESPLESSPTCTIESWFQVLSWVNLPNFGPCHTIKEYKRFINNYFFSNELDKFSKNILLTLTGGFEQQNKRLIGRPGCGKTSFIYYFKNEAKRGKNNLLSGYYFFIFHANRATGKEKEKVIQEYILTAWRKYYRTCNLLDVYNRIDQQDIGTKGKINILTDHYKKNRDKFKKLMIFVIDDADLLTNEEVKDITYYVLRNLALTDVKKWLVIRESTYNGYDIETRGLIDAFFPDRNNFPEIPLYEIIKYRIEHSSEGTNPKNPFSEGLCIAVLERLLDGNMREGLSVLKNILEYSPPGKFQAQTDETVIQNYINKNSINALLRLNMLPNLYDPIFRSTSFPIAMDTLLLNRYIKSRDQLLGAVNHVSNIRAEEAGIVSGGKTIRIRSEDFEFSLEKLIDHGLAERITKAMINQTRKGTLLADYVDRQHYTDLSKTLIYEQFGDKRFWDLVKIRINHQKISLDIITWQKFDQPIEI